MRDPEAEAVVILHHCHQQPSSKLLIVLAIVLLINSSSSIQAADTEPDGEGGKDRPVQWQILTKLNFSSQIRLHPHLLLMVTVPWSGESRSLMKDLAEVVTKKQEKFSTLKLMLVYRNSDKMLADALGANEGITIIHYHHSSSYKYQGRLRVQNILLSVYFLMSLAPKDIPLKSLTTPGDLKMFLESTDKALLVLEFCGWTTRLLESVKNNGSENAFGFNGETNETRSTEGRKNQKMMENEKMNCGVDTDFTGVSGLGEFTAVNESDFLEGKSMRPGDGVSCSLEDLQQFELFLPKLMAVAGEFFLPPERLRFGLVTERSLLSSLGVGDSSSWLAMLYAAGCPGCSKVLRGGEDLRRVLEIHASPVSELKTDERDLEPALPANKPSIFLFIDRSSDSLNVRRKSKDALDAFRELALHNQISSKTSAQNTVMRPKPSVDAYKASRSISGHPRLEVSPLSQKIAALKDKMSIMIMNEGKQDTVASDLHGSSLQEILAYVLQHKKEIRLSSLAKDAGFQLLSDDFEIKIAEALPTKAESQTFQSHQESTELSVEDLPKHNVVFDKAQASDMTDILDWEHKVLSRPTDFEHSAHQDEKISTTVSKQSLVEPNHDNIDQFVASAVDGKVKEEVEKGEDQLHLKDFNGSFFFLDGQFRFLKSLTGVSKIPSVVIIDPLSQQHYVFPDPDETSFSYSSLSSFLDRFLNKSLLPYQLSESVILDPREAPAPPFVNLDFHEVNSIPRVTTHTFSKLVVGDDSDSTNIDNAWKMDVLVLFSNAWCGFCQRMELVVREAYRAFKGYGDMMKSEYMNNKSFSRNDDANNSTVKLPLIYLMDCTRNDCSLILKSMAQRELYPSLVLFPAEKKNAVSYTGDMSVHDIMKFIADHGTDSQWIFKEKGILWTEAEQRVSNQKPFAYSSSDAMPHEEAPMVKEQSHEVLLKDRTHKIAIRSKRIKHHMQSDSDGTGTASEVVPGSILVATDKLTNVNPFDGSKILILEVNQSTGFQGLIINKHISWDSFQELEEGLELLKEAPLTFGGPTIIRGMPLVALSRKSIKDQQLEVLPEIYYLDQWATLNVIEGLKLGNETIAPYWFFLGFSSWGWDQLYNEIAEGAWNLENDNADLLDWPNGSDFT